MDINVDFRCLRSEKTSRIGDRIVILRRTSLLLPRKEVKPRLVLDVHCY